MERSTTGLDRLLMAAALAGLVLFVLALLVSPSFVGRQGFAAPESWRIFYLHVPAAFASFVAFGVALTGSVQYLRTRAEKWDRHAQCAVEVGVLLTAITLVTGMIWAQAEWGRAWSWGEGKLVVELVLFLIYCAYLILRREIANPDTRRRVAAIYAIAGFATVPLVYWAHKIWTIRHPPVFEEGGLVTPGVAPIFAFAFLTYVLLYAAFHRWRYQNLLLEAQLSRREAERGAVA